MVQAQNLKNHFCVYFCLFVFQALRKGGPPIPSGSIGLPMTSSGVSLDSIRAALVAGGPADSMMPNLPPQISAALAGKSPAGGVQIPPQLLAAMAGGGGQIPASQVWSLKYFYFCLFPCGRKSNQRSTRQVFVKKLRN